jgi:hypothetical protein
MYINKIDELIDNILDDFYKRTIINNEVIKNIIKDPMFAKYTHQINKIIKEYIDMIDIYNIKKIVGNNDSIDSIINIIKRYIMYYILMFIGFPKKDKDKYVNNLIDFCKNPSQDFTIKNFYNSENNANLIQFYDLIKNINILSNIDDMDEINELLTVHPDKFMPSIDFLNELGHEYVILHFKGNKEINFHNIIKSIIFTEIYIKQEKIEVYYILNKEEEKTGSFKYIDIVIPRRDVFDFSLIESLFPIEYRKKDIPQDLYSLLQHNKSYESTDMNTTEKILELFNKKLLVPIVDDFLRYHKDIGKFEKSTERFERDNKKEQTKIKYIVSKINKIVEYYSFKNKNNPTYKKEVEKILYQPLFYRKAILMNDIEEINVLNKLRNIGRKVLEGNEFYNELVLYRKYAFINFRDFKKNGFSIKTNKTIDAVRYSTFEYYNDNKQSILDLRTCGKKNNINIVGVLLPSNISNLYCITTKNTIDVRKNENTNGLYEILKIIRKFTDDTFFENKTETYPNNDKSTYWIFDNNKDTFKLDSYQEASGSHDDSKLILVKLYNELALLTSNRIIDKLSKYENISLAFGKKIVDNYQHKLIDLNDNTSLIKDIKKIIFHDKSIKTIKEYDKNENKIPGITNEIIKLPILKNKDEEQKTVIYGERVIVEHIEDEIDTGLTVCQHFISWNELTKYRNKKLNKFQDLLNEFYQKFVTIDKDQSYVCKSCGSGLDIKRYISSYIPGMDQDKDIITFSANSEIPLEEMQEYEKYNFSIKSIDNRIERICYVANLSYFIGSSAISKLRRQTVIKDVIDMVLLHNKVLRKTDYNKRRERGETASKLYGVSTELSNFFVFDLDNEIFRSSSKSIDKFQHLKYNNVISHILFMLINDMNINQFNYITDDKLCNYTLFDKYGFILFENLKIRTNNANTIEPIQNYKLLCYFIYYLSCLLVKYKIWSYQYSDIKGKVFEPHVQKIIIHTVVDLINSILEQTSDDIKNRYYLYTTTSAMFYMQLRNIYSDQEAIKTLHDKSTKKFVVDNKNKKMTFIQDESHTMKLLNEVIQYQYDIEPIMEGNEIYVQKPIIKLTQDTIKIIDKKYKTQYEHNNQTIYDKTNKGKRQIINNFIINRQKNSYHIYQQLLNEFQKPKNNIDIVINDFIDVIESVIGSNINIENDNKYIRFNTYIIDHDHQGNKLNNPLIIVDRNNKINYRENDSHYGTKVIFYRNKAQDMNVYYDAYTKNLLGYKETNKEFVDISGTNNYIDIHLSFINKLKYLGYTTKYIDVKEDYDKLIELKKTDKYIKQHLATKIIRNRINILKKIILDINTYLFQIRYKHKSNNNIINKYINKFEEFITYTKSWKLFKHLSELSEYIYIKPITNISISIDDHHIDIDELNKSNNNDNLLLFYMINEFEQLLNVNNKLSKSNIIYFLIYIVEFIYNSYFEVKIDSEIKKFKYIINAQNLFVDTMKDIDDIYDQLEEKTEEQVDAINEQKYDDVENDEALDIEDERSEDEKEEFDMEVNDLD